MFIYVTKELKIIDTPNIIINTIPEKLKIIPDTEFTQKNKMIVDIIGIYIPQLSDTALIYKKEDLDTTFHPVLTPLKDLGYQIELLEENNLQDKLAELEELFNDLIADISTRQIKKIFAKALKDGYFDDFLKSCNLTRENLATTKDNGEYIAIINPKIIEVTLEFFFQPADLFKIWGKCHQHFILLALLNQYRVIKTSKPISNYVLLNGEFCELQIILSDSFHRIPPLSDRSLNGNAKALGVTSTKLDIKTGDIVQVLRVESEDEIMKNFSLLREKLPEIAVKYNAQDLFLSHEVSVTQQELLSKLRIDFELLESKIADTTGSNVSKFLVDLIKHDNQITEEKKEESKLIKEILKLSQIKNLQEIPLNDFGVQPFLTVGGLLFTRTTLYPVITGNLSDCDLSSCYATYMSSMNIYLGEPIVRTFKYQKYKPTLREIIEFVKHNQPNRDAWFCRVSGNLNKANNTLIMSDLRFEPKQILCPTVNDLKASRKSIEQFNAYKTPKKQAVSTLLTKQIKFGLINADLLDNLALLPTEWYEEYLDLKVDCFVYIPTELIADNLNELSKLRESLPDEPYLENFDVKSGIKNIQTQYCKDNACLRFDIGHYWNILRQKRGVYKKAKNPVQEIYKLFGNSGYGVLACLHLATNNLLASNMITAGARSAAWLMVNGLNGFAPITDGTCFSWDTIPIGKKFRDLLAENPNYVFEYNPNVISGLSQSEVGQNWIDEKFKSHLHSFYEINDSHIPANRFNFELKEEIFKDKNGKDVKTVLFSTYHNTNAGNYSKGMDDNTVLIDGTDYNFTEQNNFVKARSFKGKDSALIDWYLSSLSNYQSPMIYSEDKLIKFADGCDMAIRILESGRFDEIALPTGFSTIAYKAMKLISRSQFLFQNEKQLKNFETNEQKLAELSKEIFTKRFWDTLSNNDLREFNVELIPGYDYYSFSKNHPVGIGFELLALSTVHKNSVQSVRKDIQTKILEGCTNFNAGLHISRNYKLAEKFKYLLAAIIVLKANAEETLINVLANSIDEPTLVTVKTENIKTLEEIKNLTDDE